MAAALRGRRFEDALAAAPAAAAWATAEVPAAALCRAEEPWVVMVGTPRWRRPELVQAQQARGAARALRLAYREHGKALLDHLAGAFAFAILGRSEEHTSELPSLMRISYAVFCLKKTNTIQP